MKRSWKTLLAAGLLSFSLSIPAFAGSWQTDVTGYWYQNDDGTYPASSWKWIDGNGDGVAECYYFNEQGYLLVSTITPDGCTVDANGAWTVNGIVQTQAVAQTPAAAPVQDQTSGQTQMPVQTQTPDTQSAVSVTGMVWIPATGMKYHRINNCGNMNPNKARSMSVEEAIQRGYEACRNCY